MSCKGIRGVCRRPHFLPLGKKKKRWIKIMIKSCEIITGIFWNTVLLPILSHCPTQPTLISISASFQTSPFYPRPLNPLLSHSFLFFCSLLSIPSFLSSFLPSHLFLPLHLCLFSHYSFLKITHLCQFLSPYLHLFPYPSPQYFSSTLSGRFWLCHGKIYVILP